MWNVRFSIQSIDLTCTSESRLWGDRRKTEKCYWETRWKNRFFKGGSSETYISRSNLSISHVPRRQDCDYKGTIGKGEREGDMNLQWDLYGPHFSSWSAVNSIQVFSCKMVCYERRVIRPVDVETVQQIVEAENDINVDRQLADNNRLPATWAEHWENALALMRESRAELSIRQREILSENLPFPYGKWLQLLIFSATFIMFLTILLTFLGFLFLLMFDWRRKTTPATNQVAYP